MKFIVSIFLSLLSSLCLANTAEYRLDNGLKLVVREDHRAPVVVSQLWYKVGASYEPGGITGISHMLEHMMFKGTETLGPGEFSRIVAENGGQDNAFTSADYTTYFQTFGRDRLEVSFQLESERMHALKLDEEEFAKEKKVVLEERRMRVEDRPPSLLYEQFNATAYLSHPYRNPVIGWMNDIENYRLEDLQAWYERWYGPNNATLVVVGDVQPQAVYELARKYFGSLSFRDIDPVKPREEVRQSGLRRIRLKTPAELPYLIMGYHVPGFTRDAQQNEDAYALLALAGILAGGDSSRLVSQLVRGSEIAASADAGYRPVSRADTLFLLDGRPSTNRGAAELEKALLEQVERLQNELVAPDELERVKTQVVAAEIYQQDSVFYQGMRIGQLETVGLDWRMLDTFTENIRRVTPERIRQVARDYLVLDNLTIAELVPLPVTQTRTADMPVGGEHVH